MILWITLDPTWACWTFQSLKETGTWNHQYSMILLCGCFLMVAQPFVYCPVASYKISSCVPYCLVIIVWSWDELWMYLKLVSTGIFSCIFLIKAGYHKSLYVSLIPKNRIWGYTLKLNSDRMGLKLIPAIGSQSSGDIHNSVYLEWGYATFNV